MFGFLELHYGPVIPHLYFDFQKMGGWGVSGNWSSENYSLENDIINSKIMLSSEALFTWGVAEDDKNSSQHIIQV